MTNLAAIVKATRASANALEAHQRWGRKMTYLTIEVERWDNRARTHRALCEGSRAAHFFLLRDAVREELAKATRNHRRAHARRQVAQSILAANPLPGDPA